MNWYKKAQVDIQYMGSYNVAGADVVKFKIGDKYWVYRLSFSEWVRKVEQLAKYSPGKALAKARYEYNGKGYEVTKDFPLGGIIREEA